MFAVSSSATMAGLEKRGVQFVPDTGIDLKGKPNVPSGVRDDPMSNMGWQKRLSRQEALSKQLIEENVKLKIVANEAIERANEMLARIRLLECDVRGYEGYRPSLARIEYRISRAMGVSHVEMRSPRRNRTVVLARQAVFYWACRLTTLSLPEIGRRMGDRDHTTVLHGKHTYCEKRAAMGRTLRPAR